MTKIRKKLTKKEEDERMADFYKFPEAKGKEIIEFYKYGYGDRTYCGHIQKDEIDGRWYLMEEYENEKS